VLNVAILIFTFSLRAFLPLLVGHVSVDVGYGPMAVRACATFSPFVLWGYKAETLALDVVHYSTITSCVVMC
jgi:hypothetical protein